MWLYKEKQINELTDMPEHSFGFIYEVTHLPTGRKYLGKKQLISVTTKALGKKELAQIIDKRASKKKKVTPVSKEEQTKAFDILKRQTKKEKASEQGFIQDQLIAQDEAIQRQRAGLNTPKPKPYTEITVPTPAIPAACAARFPR
jgi:hypothetical protein